MASAYEPQAWSADKLPPAGFVTTISRHGSTSEQGFSERASILVLNESIVGPKGGVTFPLSPQRYAALQSAMTLADCILIEVCDNGAGNSRDTVAGDYSADARVAVLIQCLARRLRHWISLINRYRAPDCLVIVLDEGYAYLVKPLHGGVQ